MKSKDMDITLIQGSYTATEAVDILNKLVSAKIKFHEDKIGTSSNEEDIKMRESRIKELQNGLKELRQEIQLKGRRINIKSVIEIN